MRRFLFLAIIFLIIGGVFFMAPERQAPSQENPFSTLQRIMELADASVVEGEFHYWASLGECPEIISLPHLEARADELFKRFATDCSTDRSGSQNNESSGGSGADYAADVTANPAEDKSFSHAVPYPAAGQSDEVPPAYMLVERERELPSGERMRLLLQRMEQEGGKVIHLLLSASGPGNSRQLDRLAYRIPTLLKPEVQNSNLSFCLTGHIEGKLSPREMEQLALVILRDIGGKQVQSIKDGGMVSITGYTPELGNYLQAENLRINLNLAMCYDNYLHKTVIWAGTPLIARQY